MYIRILLVLGLLIGVQEEVQAQKQRILNREISISRLKEEKIILDGILEEKVWQEAERARNFHQRYPFDSTFSYSKTEVMLTYDAQFLYIAAVCHDTVKGNYTITSLRRDFSTRGMDYFAIVIDPFNDQTNGFQFAVNPYGVQLEALIVNGGDGRESTNSSWDNKWFAEVKRYEDKWTVEMAIPFKSIRYRAGTPSWGVNFVRRDSKTNERTNWGWIPRNFISTSLAFTGKLIWDQPLGKPGANITAIPYLTGGTTRDFEEGDGMNWSGDLGADFKVGIGPSLNLDLTINPDFSQVEVDRQVTNLDRFEISFPERRQFFLENNDLFSSFGTSSTRPFFTRRIGLAKNIITNETVENRIWYGARLSGKVSEKTRIGLLNMQTEENEAIGVPATNYAVGVIQQQVLKRSNISAIFVNKAASIPQIVADTLDDPLSSFNRVVGVDYNHASADNRWQGKVFYHRSFSDPVVNESPVEGQFAHGVQLVYDSPGLEVQWDHSIVGGDYFAEVGFVRRTGFRRINPTVELKFYPKNIPFINRHGPQLEHEVIWTDGYGLTDRTTELSYAFRLWPGGFLRVGHEWSYVKLMNDFDPTRSDGLELLEGTDYDNRRWNILVFSDSRKLFSTFFRATTGQYFNGRRRGISGEMSYRIQPFGALSMDFSYNRITLPDPYNDATLWLLGPKIDLTFTRNLFFSTLLQYNNQIDNLNINARFQWRFAPVSDLFIVYTDNFYVNHLKVKNRGIILKWTYWLNL